MLGTAGGITTFSSDQLFVMPRGKGWPRHPDRCKVINCIIPDSLICQKNIAYWSRASGDPKSFSYIIIPPPPSICLSGISRARIMKKKTEGNDSANITKFEVLKAA